MEQHLKILGILFIIWGVLSLLAGFFIVFLFTFGGLLSGDSELLAVASMVGIAFAFFSFITGIPEIIGGWGLLNRRKWSRLLVLIMAAINVIDVPFGTALGIYAFWVLFKPESEQLLVSQAV